MDLSMMVSSQGIELEHCTSEEKATFRSPSHFVLVFEFFTFSEEYYVATVVTSVRHTNCLHRTHGLNSLAKCPNLKS
jgi:hypothetical protein